MAKRKRTELVTCPYCRMQLRHCDSERDHVPPKALFPQPRPGNLLTVRCCPLCHDELSKGDEPLKAMGGLGVFRSTHALQLEDEIYRGLRRNPWWRESFITSVQTASPLDLIVGGEIVRHSKIKINGDLAAAIHTSLKRTVIGLLFDWNPNRIVNEGDISVVQVPEEKPAILGEVLDKMPMRFGKNLGSTFQAAWDFTIEDESKGAMILSFFKGLHFIAFIGARANLSSGPEQS